MASHYAKIRRRVHQMQSLFRRIEPIRQHHSAEWQRLQERKKAPEKPAELRCVRQDWPPKLEVGCRPELPLVASLLQRRPCKEPGRRCLPVHVMQKKE